MLTEGNEPGYKRVMDFAAALDLLESGYRLRRKAWPDGVWISITERHPNSHAREFVISDTLEIFDLPAFDVALTFDWETV